MRVSFEYRRGNEAWASDSLLCLFAEVGDAEELVLSEAILASQGTLTDMQTYMLQRWGRMAAFSPGKAISYDTKSDPLGGGAFILQVIVNGLILGTIYALVAVGYGIIFSLLETVNFAFGDMAMIGTVSTVLPFAVAVTLGADVPLLVLAAISLIFAPAYVGLIGVVGETLVYRPVGRANRLAPLVAAIGFSLVLQNSALLTQGPRAKWLQPLSHAGVEFDLPGGGVRLSFTQIGVLVSGVLTAFAIWRLLVGTKFGRELRAVAADAVGASLCGVDFQGTTRRAFLLSGVLAGFGGVVFMLYYGQTDHSVGLLIGFKALTGAIIGGLGSPLGAMAGGLIIGLVEGLFGGFVSHEWRDLAIFVALVVILMIRPTGLFGSSDRTNH
ncbi:branched-chain amino acid ABC transporter permease [Lacibacterium aquatile]|uniref:Branched-chain amino acid ABC transporter permease n=1 Tax=Lacibacterium aquatile TaxID=1168082 RepID=A0ABW5DW17_9PROT